MQDELHALHYEWCERHSRPVIIGIKGLLWTCLKWKLVDSPYMLDGKIFHV